MAAAQEGAPAAKTCRYFTNLNPRTTKCCERGLGAELGQQGCPRWGGGQPRGKGSIIFSSHPPPSQLPLDFGLCLFVPLWVRGTVPAASLHQCCGSPTTGPASSQPPFAGSCKAGGLQPVTLPVSAEPLHKGYAKSQLSTIQHWQEAPV